MRLALQTGFLRQGLSVLVSSLFVPLAVLLPESPSFAEAMTVSQFNQIALACGSTVAPLTLAAVARTESRFEPLAVRDNTTGVAGVPVSRDIAVQLATRLLEAGHSVDLGLMQINSANLRKLGMTPDLAFDPCRSVSAAATILTGDYAGGDTHFAQQAALRGALSSYNTGDPVRGLDNGYVHKVELAARAVVPALDLTPGSLSAPLPATRGEASGHAGIGTSSPDPVTPAGWNVWASQDSPASALAGTQGAVQKDAVLLNTANDEALSSPTNSNQVMVGTP
jgi:type IV secretion system protein VirB1